MTEFFIMFGASAWGSLSETPDLSGASEASSAADAVCMMVLVYNH